MPAISVIISNFNGARYLPRLIETLEAQQGVELQIIVVDRDSTDESDSILALHSNIQVVKHPPETGLVSGYSAGTPFARHALFFFMNEDMWLAPTCLAECVRVLESGPRIASVMPVQWTYDGNEIVNAGIWFEPCRWNPASPSLRVRSRWHLVAAPARVSYANAGACLVLRSAYEEVGGWDATFFLDDEDTDLAIRLWQRGWECWIAPGGVVGHAVGASNVKYLAATQKPVSAKRYVGALSNFLVVGLKTFSIAAIPLAFAGWMDRLLRNIAKGRWRRMQLDWQALALTVSRLPAVAAFRKANRRWNRERRGQDFFREPAFQWEAIRDNRSNLSKAPWGASSAGSAAPTCS